MTPPRNAATGPDVTPLVTPVVRIAPARPDPTRPGRYLRTYTDDQVSAPQLHNTAAALAPLGCHRQSCRNRQPNQPNPSPQTDHRPRARPSTAKQEPTMMDAA
jgi:hypothetical protein